MARRRVISVVVIVLLGAMAATLVADRDALDALRRVSIPVLAAAFVIQFVSQLLFNTAMFLPLRPHAPALGYWEFYMARTGGVVLGGLVPVAGPVGVRLAYLRQHGVGYGEFAWATLVSNVLALAAAGALAAVATAIFWVAAGRPRSAVLLVAIGVAALGAFAFGLVERVPRWAAASPVARWQWAASLSRFTASPRTVWGVFATSLGRHALNFTTFGLLYRELAPGPTAFVGGGLVYALTSPIRMITITPSNLGVIEWLVALVGRSLAYDFSIGLVVALVYRLVSLAAQGAGVAIGWGVIARGRRAA